MKRQLITVCVLLVPFAFLGCGGGGGSSAPAANTGAFPILTSMASLLSSGMSASVLQVSGQSVIRTAASSAIFNGRSALAQQTTVNQGPVGYPTPYTQYYDTSYNLIGFHIDGKYGKKISGSSFPASANDGDSASLGQFAVYSDAALTSQIGTATLSYSVVNCCDLVQKQRADLKFTVIISPYSSSAITFEQKYVVNTSGGIVFGYEGYNGQRVDALYLGY